MAAPLADEPRIMRRKRTRRLAGAGLKPDREFEIVAEKAKALAADIIDLADGVTQCVTIEDLQRRGWTEDEIARHRDAAMVLAFGRTGSADTEEAPGDAEGEKPSALVQLHSGYELDILDPVFTTRVLFTDVPHHLARIARFAGGTDVPFSVAQHSVLMAKAAVSETGDNEVGLCCLLHDVNEIALGDPTWPGKAALLLEVQRQAMLAGCSREQAASMAARVQRSQVEIENRINRAAIRTAGLPDRVASLILDADHGLQAYDLRALSTERRDLFGPSSRPWARLEGITPLRGPRIKPWPAAEAEIRFIETLEQLAPTAAAAEGRSSMDRGGR